MNWFQEHIKTHLISDDIPARVEFETIDDLLQIDCVARFRSQSGFTHYALCNEILLAVFDDGAHWHVCGYIGDPDHVDLPKFAHPMCPR